MKNLKFFATLVILILVITMGYFVLADATNRLSPASEGAYLQWTPKSGSTHYTLVDEVTCNGNTDYNYTTVAGRRDSYEINISSIPDGATITRIDVNPCASKNSNGGSNSVVNVFYRFNENNSSDAGNYYLSGTTPIQLATTTFNNLSLLKSSLTSLEIGAVLTSGTKGAKLSNIAATIWYTLPTPPAAPTNLWAWASSTDVVVGWTDNSDNEDGFSIERGTDGINFEEIQVATTNQLWILDQNPGPGTYYYRARSHNEVGYSEYSNTASTTVW